MRIAGTVILYNPDKEVLENIQTYLPFLQKLYVMDNSTKELDFLKELEQVKKIEYISMGGNQGIAKALKDATDKAIEDGYDFLLTMDQDSKYPTEDFKYVKNYLESNDLSDVGVVAINYEDNPLAVLGPEKNYAESVVSTIQSGAVFVLDKFCRIEGYDPDLFIDLVDCDICNQLTYNGFKIILFRNILLDHKLGEKEVRRFLWIKRSKPWHSPLRLYYYFRNSYYVKNKHYISINEKFPQVKHIIYHTCFGKKKFKTLKMILQGVSDGKKGVLGKYEDRKQTRKLLKQQKKEAKK